MKRSEFLQKGLMATGALVAGSSLTSNASTQTVNKAAKTFNLNYGPHDGMFKNLAGNNFLDQIQFMYDQGFRGIEDNGMSGRSPQEQEKIGNLLAKLGMAMGVFVLNKGGNGANTLAAGKKDHIDIFLKGCHEAVEISKRCGGKFTTVVPGDFARNLSLDMQTAHVIDALRKGAEILEPHGIVMVLEPLSDTPDLFLRTSNQTYLICRAVNSPSCKILYDIYHMQRNEGDLIANMERTWSEIAYIQTGDNPGRKEPTTGEINYKNIFKYLYEKGYKGVVGMEHGVSGSGKDGEQRLIEAYREVDAFM
ncbi:MULTISPECIES: hydroxypyruvate isomerase family protein [Olivibacter]|jgi:hydroxypyruvate isomerase|uniref:Xylose isomerase domain-containing protein TIM barrel n=3 Tax=Sphingobacteriaceae TaxID=84566 RepID=F4C2B2_SPHS2|nr:MULTISPECIES: TIM barrel protein [Olivibacter]MCL4638855.1 TIM barrel protein [Olivibacter sp. UJ_SKK_5.1]MDM8175305.1 TIM barrel protein [Olivibacter sp. 47]MDX3913017.1 TIM barrel protein [Pseudosphingobacterium sp.]QEL02069.1 TIM barrel protein [Olivibacter sp. LS-1]